MINYEDIRIKKNNKEYSQVLYWTF